MTAATLKIAPTLALPLNFATEGVAAIGMRGSGKSNTLRRWAEVLNKAGIPFVAIDPKGDWWGLRSSADGKSEGLSVAVFGGLYATDGLPIEEHLGDSIADLLVDTGMSAVLDVSRLSHGARARFLTDFCHELMDRHQLEPHVRCVILEEAHRYIPQEVRGPTAAVKEAASSILLEGRAFGLGCWAATQRPARLHKDVLEEVGTAVIHRIGAAASNDLKTIAGWVKHEDLGPEIVPSLTKLLDGEAWILAPSTLGIAQRVRIDRSHTFDSGATPLVGVGSRPTVTLAEVDTAAIKEALAEAIEYAKDNDPAELRRRLAAAEERIREFEMWEPPPPVVNVGLSDELADLLAGQRHVAVAAAHAFAGELAGLSEVIDRAIAEREASTVPVSSPSPRAPKPETPVLRDSTENARNVAENVKAPRVTRAPAADGEGGKFKGAEQKILVSLAQYNGTLTLLRLAAMCGYHQRTKHFTNCLGSLRSAGLIDGRDTITLTPDGRAAAAALPVPTIGDPIAHWKAMPKVTGTAGRILDILSKAWPDPVDVDDLAAALNYHPRTKHFTNSLGQLRGLDLVGRDRAVRFTEDFGAAVDRYRKANRGG